MEGYLAVPDLMVSPRNHGDATSRDEAATEVVRVRQCVCNMPQQSLATNGATSVNGKLMFFSLTYLQKTLGKK